MADFYGLYKGAKRLYDGYKSRNESDYSVLLSIKFVSQMIKLSRQILLSHSFLSNLIQILSISRIHSRSFLIDIVNMHLLRLQSSDCLLL